MSDTPTLEQDGLKPGYTPIKADAVTMLRIAKMTADESDEPSDIRGLRARTFHGAAIDLARLPEAEKEIERLREALEKIVEFCDDPHGSDKPETLAMGLARLLPAARAALQQKEKP